MPGFPKVNHGENQKASIGSPSKLSSTSSNKIFPSGVPVYIFSLIEIPQLIGKPILLYQLL